MTVNVFAYGSLMYPEVLTALAGALPSFEDLCVQGFERRVVGGKPYPGLRENPASSVDGRLWFDIDDETLRILDGFEGSLYERRTLRLVSRRRGSVNAEAYIVPASRLHALADVPWERERFERHYLGRYVKICRGFRAAALRGRL